MKRIIIMGTINPIIDDDVSKLKHFPRYWWRESAGDWLIPLERPVTRSYDSDVFFYLALDKRLSKQPEALVIWGTIAFIMTSLPCVKSTLCHSAANDKKLKIIQHFKMKLTMCDTIHPPASSDVIAFILTSLLWYFKIFFWHVYFAGLTVTKLLEKPNYYSSDPDWIGFILYGDMNCIY